VGRNRKRREDSLETDEEKVEKIGERGGEKRKGDAPQGSSVTSEKWV